MALRISNTRFVKVWKIEGGEYGPKFTLGTSRKDQNGNYINCNWFGCKFVGDAKAFGESLAEGDTIKIVSGQLENVYNKEKKVSYFNMVIFEAEHEGNNKPQEQTKEVPSATEESTDPFPF